LASMLLLSLPALAQYSAQRENGIVRLEDTARQTVVLINPARGNNAFQMRVKGKDVVRFPHASVDEYLKSAGRGLAGVPFLGPWANRLDEPAFYANGKKYVFNLELGNVRPGAGNIPIHGFLTNAEWQVVDTKSDRDAAWVTSRLEVWKQPQWMAQWPFAHTLEMTYRLHEGALEVRLKIENLSTEAMPVAVGFHPYFQVNDAPRDEWTFGLAAKTEWLLAPNKIPTGEKRPIEQLLPKPQASTLQGLNLDHVFGDLIRDSNGNATMYVQGKSERIEVAFGPNYRAAVVYAPAGPQNKFICFEPMTGITDAINLAHRNLYSELQTIPPGKSWQESFWIRPMNF